MTINLQGILKGIAEIESATQNPMVKALIMKALPELGLTPEQLAQLEANHEDYQRMLQELSADAPPAGQG